MSATLADVQERVLPNGMRVLVREDHTTPVVALNFWVRVGSNNEAGELQGWSHGIEHMLFKGTQKRPAGAIAREIKNAGGETNAGTGYETTNYYIVVPKEEIATALDIHADVLMNSTFDPGELENERQVLIEENQMYRDRPSGYGITWEELFKLGFTTHRYRHPIGGPDLNLRETPREVIVDYKNRYYAPGNIVYVIVGDVDADETFARVERAFQSFTAPEVAGDTSPVEPGQAEFRFREFEGDVARVYGKIGFHIPPELTQENDDVHVLAHILGVGRSSRLYSEVREREGLVTSVSVLNVTGFDPGYLVVDFQAAPEKAVDALLAILREIGRLRREPVTAEELEKTKTMVRSDFVFGLETVEGQASILGHYATLGDVTLASRYPERVAAVTAERVLASARRHFGARQASVVLYVPRGTKLVEDVARLEGRIGMALEGVSGGASDANDTAVWSGRRSRFDVTRTRFENGLTVLSEPQRSLPIVAVAAYIRCGSGEETKATNGLTHLMQQMLLKGAGGRSSEEIAATLEALGAHLRPFGGKDVAGVSLSVLKERLPEAMAIFTDLIRSPEFPEPALEREKTKLLSDIEALRDNSLQFTMQRFSEILFDGHPYGMPVLGNPEAIPGLSRQAIGAWHGSHYVPERMVVSVVGDMDSTEAVDLIQEHFGDMKPGANLPEVAPASTKPRTRRVLLEKEVAQAVIVLGCPGPANMSADRYAVDVLMAVLSGMGNRLFYELRDRQHLCYFTGAFGMSLSAGGAVAAYIGTRPENEEQATRGLLNELRKARETEPTPEEMLRAKNTIAGGYVIDLQRRAARASLLAQDEVSGLGYEEALRYLDRIRAVTPAEVRDAAARYFNLDQYALAVLKPGPA
jgi:zinc protease